MVLISATCLTVRDLLARVVLRKGSDEYAFAVLHDFFAFLGLIPFLFLYPFRLPNSTGPYFGLFLATIFYALADLTNIMAFSAEEASVVVPLTRIRNIFVVIGSALFLHEPLTVNKILGVILILAGSMIISFKGKKIKLSRGIWFTLAYSFCIASGMILDKAFVANYSLPVYTSLIFFLPSFWLLLYSKFDFKRVIKEQKKQGWGVALVGILLGWTVFSFTAAILKQQVSKVALAAEISLVFSVIGAVVILKEKENLTGKIIGSLILLLGVCLVSL